MDHNSIKRDAGALYGDLGERIALLRRAAGLTQEDLAARAGIGRPTLANIEKGRQRIFYHQLLDLAAALGCDSRQLLPLPSEESAVLGHLHDLQPPADVVEWVRRGLSRTGEDGMRPTADHVHGS